MIQAIGIDAVEVERFKHWHTFSHKKLARVFSAHEIDYCLSNQQKSAERFAVRFAAKEALFKAISQLGITVPFLTLCKATELYGTPAPQLRVTWSNFASPFDSAQDERSRVGPEEKPDKPTDKQKLIKYTTLASLTHTKTTAIAIVYIQ